MHFSQCLNGKSIHVCFKTDVGINSALVIPVLHPPSSVPRWGSKGAEPLSSSGRVSKGNRIEIGSLWRFFFSRFLFVAQKETWPPEADCDHEDPEAYCRLGRRRRKQSGIIPFAVPELGRPVLLSAHRSGSGLIYPSIPAWYQAMSRSTTAP